MKKILSLTLAALMLVSMIPTAMAADVDVQQGTQVTVVGAGGEYTVTVPATLEPGQTGTVTAKGYWAAEDTLKVTAPETIEVTNTATNQKATINVDFDGIESLGNDLEEMTIPVSISIDTGNTKFGTWTGTIVYNVELVEPPKGNITFTIDGTEYQAEDGMTFAEWVPSEYNTDGYKFGQCSTLTFDVLATADGYVLKDGIYFASPTTPVQEGTAYIISAEQIKGTT